MLHSAPAGTDGLSSGGDDHKLDGGQGTSKGGRVAQRRMAKESLKEPSEAGERL